MGQKQAFVNRKVHSLLGLIPLAVFLCFHLTINFMATKGASVYNEAATMVGNMPLRYLVEVVIIFLPILLHGIYGVYIAYVSRNNVGQYATCRNWNFYIQRISGVFLLVFISIHVWQTRIQAMFGEHVDFNMMEQILSSPWWFAFYVLGVICATYHLGNGIWLFCVSWGITVTPKSQKVFKIIAMAVFVGITYMGVQALLAFIDPVLKTM